MPQTIPVTGNTFLDTYFGRRSELERLRSEAADRALRDRIESGNLEVSRQNAATQATSVQQTGAYHTADLAQRAAAEADRVKQQERQNSIAGLGLYNTGAADFSPPPTMDVTEDGEVSMLPNSMPAIDLGNGMRMFPTTREEQEQRITRNEGAKRTAIDLAQQADVAKRNKALESPLASGMSPTDKFLFSQLGEKAIPFMSAEKKSAPMWEEYVGALNNPTAPGSAQKISGINTFLAAQNRGANTRSENNLEERSYQYHATELDKIHQPITDRLVRLGNLEESLKAGNAAIDPLIAPELLTVAAGGQSSGLRMSEAEIARVIDGRDKMAGFMVALKKWTTGESIDDVQRHRISQFVGALGKKLREKDATLSAARQALASSNDPAEQRRLLAGTKAKLSAIDFPTGSLPQGNGQPITPEAVAQFVKAADHDKAKAIALAKENGWKVD